MKTKRTIAEITSDIGRLMESSANQAFTAGQDSIRAEIELHRNRIRLYTIDEYTSCVHKRKTVSVKGFLDALILGVTDQDAIRFLETVQREADKQLGQFK